MRSHAILTTLLVFGHTITACSSDSDNSGGDSDAGGSTSQQTSGSTTSGGATTTMGGAQSTGGTNATSSANPNGGATTTATGGATTMTGGTSATGGTTSGTTGGGSGRYAPGNPPVPSSGCGKALDKLTTGDHTITSAGLERDYILSIPDNYNPEKPYRLVFGMHWMGGSASAVKGESWYRLMPLDTEKSTIWIAPQGYTDGNPWRRSDDKDHVLFEDLVKLLESELCIDMSRIFSIGFSFGAMFTNSLAQTHQDTLRGVVVYSTADFNIYFPENTGKPLSYMGVHGILDGSGNNGPCPFESGRRSMQRFATNNKCTVPATLPEAKAGSAHVTYDYECPDGYKVRWASFDGGHTDYPNDPGSSKTWTPTETWEFITQF